MNIKTKITREIERQHKKINKELLKFKEDEVLERWLIKGYAHGLQKALDIINESEKEEV